MARHCKLNSSNTMKLHYDHDLPSLLASGYHITDFFSLPGSIATATHATVSTNMNKDDLVNQDDLVIETF